MSHLPERPVSSQEVARAAQAAGFRQPELQIAVAIAMAESGASPVGSSGGNANAHNDRGEDSRGLWQINVASNANPDLKGMNLYDPATNAKAAMIIKQRQGWMAWSVFRPDKGAKYLLFMPKAGVAVQSLPAGAKISENPLVDPVGAVAEPVSDTVGAIKEVGKGIGQGVGLAAKAGTWIANPRNMLRASYVIVGGILLIAALVVVAAPITKPVVQGAAKAADIAL